MKNCFSQRVVVLFIFFVLNVSTIFAADVTITVDAASPIRTIPMTMYGGNLTAWDGAQSGSNSTFNNLLKASGRKYLRWPGGSWGDAFLWNDMEGPNNSKTWIVSYPETLNLLNILSQPGQTVPPTLQPIVNFPGYWFDTLQDDTPGDETNLNYAVAHRNAVNAAAAWVQDQTSRTPCAQYWEIGNETGGPWEAGYFATISGTYYGNYFADFWLAMKAVNPNIKIGANAEPYHGLQPWGWYQGYWTYDTLIAAAAKNAIPDYLIIHQYPGSYEPASYNPTLLADRVNDIAQFTANMDGIVANALGPSRVGQIRYWMTEWDGGNDDDDAYQRREAYVNAMFHVQYIMEMCKYNWEGSNAWAQWEYGSNYFVYPVWYVHPLLINCFGRDMVQSSDTHSLVRSYAALDDQDDLTVLIVNNSPTASLTADINISGFLAGAGGQRWMTEPAGTLVTGGINNQDLNNISINGTVHPDPLTVSSLPSQNFISGNSFSLTLPASCIMFLKVPAGTGDLTPPAAPTGLSLDLTGIAAELNWDDNSEPDLGGYNVYRSTTSGGGYVKLNGVILTASQYTDYTTVGMQTYYYVVRAVDTSWNESANSNERSVSIPRTAMGTILRQWWTNVPGTAVSNLTSNANYPNNPTGLQQINLLEAPINWADNYGTRIRGYVYPPATGSYTFWIAGDDNCQLWLSTNGTAANKVLIAQVSDWTDSREWTKYASQRSAAKTLLAGQKYYIEVLHKEGTGGDNIAIAWSGPGIEQQVIPGRYLSPWLTGLYGDFDGSGEVLLNDFVEFADAWLSGNCALTSGIDLNGDCFVDLYEFASFAANWLSN
ncbi:MAG: hypothetical protein LLF76_00130 [Planctomycetaceae bacterium]|nr:hypothetical protein [Planctomycetaceae bacterium]